MDGAYWFVVVVCMLLFFLCVFFCFVLFCFVFLVPAFTRLGHECQDLLSPCDGMHVCTD